MKIHEDSNGVAVFAAMEEVKEGHVYRIDIGNERYQNTLITFQQGPVKESGVNGITNEALLAILIHRTRFLNQKFPCRENSIAITKMEEALMWFEKRTKDREERGVEGTNTN